MQHCSFYDCLLQTMKVFPFMLGAVLLYGCGNPAPDASKPGAATSTTAPTQPKPACSLLMESDAKLILGEKVQAGMQTESMCQYLSGSDDLRKAGESVSLTIHKNAGNEFDKYITDTETSMNVKTEPLNGVGQKAAWADGTLIVQQAADLLVITVGIKAEKEKQTETAKTLANKIISRM